MWWNFIWSITESLDCQQFQRSNAKRMLYPHVFYIWNSYHFVPVFHHHMALNSRGLHISYYLHASNTEGILPLPVDHRPSFHFSRWLHIIFSKDVQVVNLSLLSPHIWQKDYISGWKLGNFSYKPVSHWVTSLTSCALVFAKDKMEGIKFPSRSRRSDANFCSLCDERQAHNLTGVWTQHRIQAQALHNSLRTETKFSIPVPEQLRIWCPRTDLKSNTGKGRKNRDKFLK